MPLLSWIRLIDVHQNAVFEMGKNRRRARVTGNRCNKVLMKMIGGRFRVDRLALYHVHWPFTCAS